MKQQEQLHRYQWKGGALLAPAAATFFMGALVARLGTGVWVAYALALPVGLVWTWGLAKALAKNEGPWGLLKGGLGKGAPVGAVVVALSLVAGGGLLLSLWGQGLLGGALQFVPHPWLLWGGALLAALWGATRGIMALGRVSFLLCALLLPLLLIGVVLAFLQGSGQRLLPLLRLDWPDLLLSAGAALAGGFLQSAPGMFCVLYTRDKGKGSPRWGTGWLVLGNLLVALLAFVRSWVEGQSSSIDGAAYTFTLRGGIPGADLWQTGAQIALGLAVVWRLALLMAVLTDLLAAAFGWRKEWLPWVLAGVLLAGAGAIPSYGGGTEILFRWLLPISLPLLALPLLGLARKRE